jgi:hypothetical protein
MAFLTRQRKVAVVALAALATVLATAPARAQIRAGEYQVKAAFLVNLAKFVQWPLDAPSGELVIGVIGDEFFSRALDQLVSGKNIQGRDVVVRRLRWDDDLDPCHIVFVASSEARHLPDILARTPQTGVLTVGESPDFLRDGGLVRFYLERNRMRVQIDGTRAADAGLKISSQLLSLGEQRIQ